MQARTVATPATHGNQGLALRARWDAPRVTSSSMLPVLRDDQDCAPGPTGSSIRSSGRRLRCPGMGASSGNRSVEFFEAQFRRQVQAHDYELNPFETRALDYLAGMVLDLGCGLGNLSLEAARRGHRAVAVDASAAACARVRADAEREGLPVRVIEADLGRWSIDGRYTTIACIGLLMFFRRERALELLLDIQRNVEPGGRAIVNVLVEGTTYLDMFQPGGYYLFGRDELEERFTGWRILSSVHETFPAPGHTRKEFSTVIAEKPRGTPPTSGKSQQGGGASCGD